MKQLEITGKIIARNTIFNFSGRVLPLIIGIITIPFIVRGLGEERFGLLSLIWIVLGYFTIFDLGLGRATTKYIAEALGKGQTDQIADITWTAISVQALFGVLGTIIVLFSSSFLAERILNISPSLIEEALLAFRVLAFSVPIVLITSSFSAVLEATQRFDLINAVKIPVSVLTFVLPLIGLEFHFNLPGIIMLILFARVAALAALASLAFYVTPHIRKIRSSLSQFPRLISFGGWVAVSNILGPTLQYLDRFLIGSILTMTVVAYYTAPFDAMSRLWIIPGSLVMTIFPAFSSLGIKRINEVQNFFLRASKYIFFIMSIITLFPIIFAQDILALWLGKTFAENSTNVLRVLSLGILASSLTHLSLALFQGIGRPDIAVKIQAVLLPVSILLTIILIKTVGIVGAAISWTFCRIVGLIISWRVAWKLISLRYEQFVEYKLLNETIWFMVLSLFLVPEFFIHNIFLKGLTVMTVYTIFVYLGWQYILDRHDRKMIATFIKKTIHHKHISYYGSNINDHRKR